MSDLIKREDAIKVISDRICDNKWVCECAINSLPSADDVSRVDVTNASENLDEKKVSADSREMTREEAIKFWEFRYENAKDYTDPHWEAQERREHREYVEALRMAIDALSAPQTDLISRADAIRELCRSSVYKWSVEEDQLAHNWSIGIINSIQAVPQSEQYKKGFEDAKRAFLVEYARESEVEE